jgi:predicted transcriptional regulator
MLNFLISSGSRRKILIYLLKHPDEEYHLRELSRRISEPAPVVKRELDKLDQLGFIVSWVQGNQRRFRPNRSFLFWPELKSMLEKSETQSAPVKVAETYTLREIVRRRKGWGKRSREVLKAYSKNLERKRPRHPAEAEMLENLA